MDEWIIKIFDNGSIENGIDRADYFYLNINFLALL